MRVSKIENDAAGRIFACVTESSVDDLDEAGIEESNTGEWIEFQLHWNISWTVVTINAQHEWRAHGNELISYQLWGFNVGYYRSRGMVR